MALKKYTIQALCDDSTGALVGFIAANGKEYVINVSLLTSSNQSKPIIDPAAVAFTNGNIDGVTLGLTTPVVLMGYDHNVATFQDISGTPGSGNIGLGSGGNGLATVRGRAAFAAGTNSVVVNAGTSFTTQNSAVLTQLRSNDATLKNITVTTALGGNITFTGDANATATTVFDFVIYQ